MGKYAACAVAGDFDMANLSDATWDFLYLVLNDFYWEDPSHHWEDMKEQCVAMNIAKHDACRLNGHNLCEISWEGYHYFTNQQFRQIKARHLFQSKASPEAIEKYLTILSWAAKEGEIFAVTLFPCESGFRLTRYWKENGELVSQHGNGDDYLSCNPFLEETFWKHSKDWPLLTNEEQANA